MHLLLLLLSSLDYDKDEKEEEDLLFALKGRPLRTATMREEKKKVYGKGKGGKLSVITWSSSSSQLAPPFEVATFSIGGEKKEGELKFEEFFRRLLIPSSSFFCPFQKSKFQGLIKITKVCSEISFPGFCFFPRERECVCGEERRDEILLNITVASME